MIATLGRLRTQTAGSALALFVAAVSCATIPALAEPGVKVAAVERLGPATPSGPQKPAEANAAAAYSVLDNHCARCHQKQRVPGRVNLAYPANILDLNALSRLPDLITPGDADRSKLYQLMLERRMPPSASSAALTGPEPNADDVAAIRAWIEGLEPKTSTCETRKRVDRTELANHIKDWLEQLDKVAARDTRFISLAHLYNGCATAREMSVYRQATAKLLSSLSWSPLPARIQTLGDHHTLIAFRLADIGWVPAHWQRLVTLAPPRVGRANTEFKAAAARTGSENPLVPADWLAATALRAPHYYDLLGLPTTLDALARLLRVPIAANLSDPSSGRVKRAGIVRSTLTGAPRLVERHALEGRLFWRIFDLAKGPEGPDILRRPLSPDQSGPPDDSFSPLAQRLIFSLPNGLPAYVLTDGSGRRIDRLPAASLANNNGPAPATEPGLGCMSCHVATLKPATDEVRAVVESSDFAGDPTTVARVSALHPTNVRMQALFARDNGQLRSALKKAGINPSLTLDGEEVVNALARSYTRDVSLARAAADLDLTVEAFRAKLVAVKEHGADDARMLALGPINRDRFEPLATVLLSVPPTSSRKPPKKNKPAHQAARRNLALWATKPVFKVGDLVSFFARTDADCHLTIISIDDDGQSTVLYPNDFERDNLLAAGKTLQVPDPKAGYQLRFKQPGVETLVGICTTDFDRPPGITHDFPRQRFTVLGDWPAFLRSAFEADNRINRAKPPPEPNRRRRIRGIPPPKPQPNRAGRPAPQSRTAITITIRKE